MKDMNECAVACLFDSLYIYHKLYVLDTCNGHENAGFITSAV